MMNYPVLTGAEAFYLQGGPIGILICHGFNATPQSVRDVGEAFAAKGFTVYAPRLRGHGTNVREFEQSTARCWKQSLQDGYARLQETCDQVFVIGQSMGATLALSLAADGIPFSGIVTINAALSVPSYEALSFEDGPQYLPEGAPDIKRSAFEIIYDFVPSRCAFELVRLMDETKGRLGSILLPTLILYSATDHVVPPSSSDYLHQHIGTNDKRSYCLLNSYHVATLDHDQDLIVRETIRFIERSSRVSQETG